MDRKILYYLIGCIGSRSVIIMYIPIFSDTTDLYFIGIFYIFVATQYIYSNFLDSSVSNPIFLKPIHAVIYLAVAFFAFRGYITYVWKILLCDLVFGLVIHSAYNILPLCKPTICNTDNEAVCDKI